MEAGFFKKIIIYVLFKSVYQSRLYDWTTTIIVVLSIFIANISSWYLSFTLFVLPDNIKITSQMRQMQWAGGIHTRKWERGSESINPWVQFAQGGKKTLQNWNGFFTSKQQRVRNSAIAWSSGILTADVVRFILNFLILFGEGCCWYASFPGNLHFNSGLLHADIPLQGNWVGGGAVKPLNMEKRS